MITLTPDKIELIRSQAETACNDRNGAATCLHTRADVLLALAEMAQENERLREVVRTFLEVEPESNGDGVWIGGGTLYNVDDPDYELAQLALECIRTVTHD